MVVIEDFEKGLDSGSLEDLLLAHLPGDLERVPVDAGHESVTVRAVVAPVVVRLHHDALLARVAPAQHYHHLAGFHDLTHDVRAFSWLSVRALDRKREKTGLFIRAVQSWVLSAVRMEEDYLPHHV